MVSLDEYMKLKDDVRIIFDRKYPKWQRLEKIQGLKRMHDKAGTPRDQYLVVDSINHACWNLDISYSESDNLRSMITGFQEVKDLVKH